MVFEIPPVLEGAVALAEAADFELADEQAETGLLRMVREI